MKRLSIGTISALFLAGAVSPAAFANVSDNFEAQNPSVSQLPGAPQTPGQGQTPGTTPTPGQTPNQTPGQMQTPGTTQTPGQTPRQTPGQPQTPGQMQTPNQPRTPGTTQNPGQMHTPGQTPRQTPGQYQTPGQMRTPSQAPGQTPGSSTEFRGVTGGDSLSSDAVSPFQLAYMAVRGELETENYSPYEIRRGIAQGQNIVEAAVNQGYISSDLMEDGAYIDQVNQVLRMQARDWRS